MDVRAKHPVGLLLALLLGACLLTGCGGGPHAGDGHARSLQQRQQEGRARQVADAWRGSASAAAWSEGYYPMADAVRIPRSGWRGKADEQAYERENFTLRTDLPTASAGHGKVVWKSGGTLSRPLWGARKAYRSFARGDSEGPRLTVTGVRLGETTITTSRGTATVPAWLFTLEGYDTPLERVAAVPSKLPAPPITQAGPGSAGGLERLARLAGIAGNGRSLTVRATHGACDDGPVVKAVETDESVVLYASVAGARSGPCTAALLEESVGVELREPLAGRILLDAFTGRPVPYGESDGPSPSWT